MEFFATLKTAATEQDLQQQLQLETLPRFCASIYEISKHADGHEVSMIWGLFTIRRECIRGGIRFTLPNCLNGVAWTVTASLDESIEEEVTIHCTINRRQQDADFVESLEEFVLDWRKGLNEHLRC